MAEWTDTTSYRKGERGAEPRTWTIKRASMSIVITKGHIYNPDMWVMHCSPWFDTHDLGLPGTAPADEAKAEALRKVLAKLRKAAHDFAETA